MRVVSVIQMLLFGSRSVASSRTSVSSFLHHSPRGNNFRLMSSITPAASSSSPPTKWSDVVAATNGIHRSYANNLFPPLTSSSHKGSHGRIAILGGSEKYTGAPFYAAQSALLCGVDLVTVFTAKEASIPLKCYSPELMVQSVYSIDELDHLIKEEEDIMQELEECKQSNDLLTNEVNKMEVLQTMEKLEISEEKQSLLIQSELKNKDDEMESLVDRLTKMKYLEEKLQNLRERQDSSVEGIVNKITSTYSSLHALCIGPGLGRHPLVFSAVEKVIYEAIESKLTLVLDADALFMLSLKEHKGSLEKLLDYERCVMTPNLMEMRRLDEALGSKDTKGERSLGVHGNIIVQKGNVDIITQGSHAMKCKEEGGLKRSGGIGDVLAGTLSAFMAWNAILDKDKPHVDGGDAHIETQQRLFASWTSCCAVKIATKVAYQKKKRAMSALDVIGEIGEVICKLETLNFR